MSQEQIELHAFRVLDALLRENSATKAAKQLGVSQPAVSATLARLRTVIGDELFTRTPDGLAPTARAAELKPAVCRLLEILDQEILCTIPFHPSTSQRTFVLSLGELGQVELAAQLVPRMIQLAPSMGLKFTSTSPARRRDDLVKGSVDVAIGHFPYFVGDDIFQTGLGARHRFVGVARRGHPILSEPNPTAALFQSFEHVAIGQDYPPILDTAFEQLGIQRRIRVELSLMAGADQLIANTDLLATVPESLGRSFTNTAEVEMFIVPAALPPLEVKLFWHRRSHSDPGLRWLRAFLVDTFRTRGQTAGATV